MKFTRKVASLLALATQASAVASFRDQCIFLDAATIMTPALSYMCVPQPQEPYFRCSTLYLDDCLQNYTGQMEPLLGYVFLSDPSRFRFSILT